MALLRFEIILHCSKFINLYYKWYKHMETYHTYPSVTPVHNLKLSEKYLHVYLCLIFWAITQQPCCFSGMNEEKIFGLILW